MAKFPKLPSAALPSSRGGVRVGFDLTHAISRTVSAAQIHDVYALVDETIGHHRLMLLLCLPCESLPAVEPAKQNISPCFLTPSSYSGHPAITIMDHESNAIKIACTIGKRPADPQYKKKICLCCATRPTAIRNTRQNHKSVGRICIQLRTPGLDG